MPVSSTFRARRRELRTAWELTRLESDQPNDPNTSDFSSDEQPLLELEGQEENLSSNPPSSPEFPDDDWRQQTQCLLCLSDTERELATQERSSRFPPQLCHGHDCLEAIREYWEFAQANTDGSRCSDHTLDDEEDEANDLGSNRDWRLRWNTGWQERAADRLRELRLSTDTFQEPPIHEDQEDDGPFSIKEDYYSDDSEFDWEPD